MTIATCDSQVDYSTHVVSLEGHYKSGGNLPVLVVASLCIKC